MNSNRDLAVITIGILAAMILIAPGCSMENKNHEFTWTPDSQTMAPDILKSTQFKTNEITVIANDEIIERAPQKFGSAEIEGTFLQKISTTSGKTLYIKSQYSEADFSKYAVQIEKLNTQRFAFLEHFKKYNPILKYAAEVFPPKVIIQNNNNTTQILYSIDFINSERREVSRMKVLPTTEVKSVERVSSNFEQGKGIVFPAGPKASPLSEVILSGLVGDGSLTKQNLKVNAQISEKAHSTNLVFDYDPQDARFDQVQSFYFADKALSFFQSKLGITLPFGLEIQTHYGAPEKLNAMFYYHGQIRLGLGDGINYNNIMKDPSIVIHESCHGIIEAIARLPMGEGEGGSLNEGFADFFTTTLLNNPNLGEVAYLKGPYKRTVTNSMKVSEKNGGLYHDSLILSGTFWEIKEALGEQKTINLAVKTLGRLGPSGNFLAIDPAVRFALSSGFSDKDKQTTLEILKKRGWL